jgi:ankyrin repeat protein
MTVDNCSRHDSAWHFFSDFNAGIAVATTSKTEQTQSATSNTGISVVHSANKVDPSESSHFHFKDNTERSIDLVKIFEAKYRECFCNHLTQLITDLENSTSIDHIVDACNCFNNNISNSTYNNTSLNGVTLSVDANIDFENSKNNLITDSKNLLASYQVTVLEKQEKTEPNIELKENNAFFRFFNSVIKLLTKFINFFQQGHMLNKLNDVIDKKKSLNETELANLINQLNQTSLDKALLYSTQQGNVEILNMLVQAKANVNTKNKYGNTPLILAAVQGNVEIIDLLIKAGADINAKDKFNQTALIKALAKGKYVVAKKLLEYKANVNIVTINGSTALIFAISKMPSNKITDEIIDELIEKSNRETLYSRRHRINNAMYYAISYNNLPAVKKILKKKFLVNCLLFRCNNSDKLGNALHLSIYCKHSDTKTKLEIIKELLDAGINTNLKDGNRRTALEAAKLKASSCQEDYEPIVEVLQEKFELNRLYEAIDKKKSLNETEVTKLISKLTPSSHDTALIYSAEQDNIEILNKLIAAGANINTQNKNGITPLMEAAKQGNIEIINRLIAAGADINAKDNFNQTALIIAIFNRQYYTAKKLLEYNPDVHVVTKNGNTALTLIAGRSLNNNFTDDLLYEVSDEIMDKYSTKALNIQNNDGYTPLLAATFNGNLHTVKKLIERGALVSNTYKFGSALHAAINLRYIDTGTIIEIIKLLLATRIDTNIKDDKGRTALEVAKIHAREAAKISFRDYEKYKLIVELLEYHIQN